MGLAMGATGIAIVMSPWGKRFGGHFNPAITLTSYRTGKVEFWDGLFYVFAQLLGAIGGVALARYVLGGALSNQAGSLNPTSVTISGAAAQTSTLTVSTTAASSAENRQRSLFWPSASGARFALVLLFVGPRKQKDRVALIGLLLLFVSTGLIACGGGSNGSGGRRWRWQHRHYTRSLYDHCHWHIRFGKRDGWRCRFDGTIAEPGPSRRFSQPKQWRTAL